MKKIAFVLGEGIGNQIEQISAFKAACLIYPEAKFDIINTVPHCFWFTQYLYNNHPRVEGVYNTKTVPINYKADGKLISPYVKDIPALKDIKCLNKKTHNNLEMIYNSEVSTNIMFVTHDKVPKEIYDVSEFFPVKKDIEVKKYDVVLHNGCNTNTSIKGLWDVKKYEKFNKVIKVLKREGYSICSIGKKDEYINNTVDETGKPIEESIELIRNCKLFISNDTGTYHIAAALKKLGIVLFTATSPWKNYDKIFHKTIHLIRRTDLNCSPCQKKGNGYWLKCNHQNCRDIHPQEIVDVALKFLKSKKEKENVSPKISIITRTYNRLEYTIQCITNIHQLTNMDDYEHIIIDQGSTDGTREWLNSIHKENYYKNLKIKFNKENSGDAGGMKDGYVLSNPKSKYIMQFDSDCKPLNKNFLDTMVKIMDNNDNIAMLMMFREGVNTQIKPLALHIIDGNLLGEIDKATCCFITRRNIIDSFNIWKDKEEIGWGFKLSDKIRSLGNYKIMKTMDIKVSHIDGTNLQAVKYPLYHKSTTSEQTNYREINYNV